jgi:hypothetical protein
MCIWKASRSTLFFLNPCFEPFSWIVQKPPQFLSDSRRSGHRPQSIASATPLDRDRFPSLSALARGHLQRFDGVPTLVLQTSNSSGGSAAGG